MSGMASLGLSPGEPERHRGALSAPPHALVGRDDEVAALARMLAEPQSLPRAEGLLGRTLRLTEWVGDARRTAIASAFLGHLARARGDHEAAVAH